MYNPNIMEFALYNANYYSYDPSAKVACVFVDANDNIISVGVNELKNPNVDSNYICNDKDVKKYLYQHAEISAFNNLTVDKKNIYSVYVTYPPCLQCMVELLLNNDIEPKYIYYINRGSESFKQRYMIDKSLKLAKNICTINEVQSPKYDNIEFGNIIVGNLNSILKYDLANKYDITRPQYIINSENIEYFIDKLKSYIDYSNETVSINTCIILNMNKCDNIENLINNSLNVKLKFIYIKV